MSKPTQVGFYICMAMAIILGIVTKDYPYIMMSVLGIVLFRMLVIRTNERDDARKAIKKIGREVDGLYKLAKSKLGNGGL